MKKKKSLCPYLWQKVYDLQKVKHNKSSHTSRSHQLLIQRPGKDAETLQYEGNSQNFASTGISVLPIKEVLFLLPETQNNLVWDTSWGHKCFLPLGVTNKIVADSYLIGKQWHIHCLGTKDSTDRVHTFPEMLTVTGKKSFIFQFDANY